MINKVYINVPYSEKDKAKQLGARWDNKQKSWYYTNKNNKAKFSKWEIKVPSIECLSGEQRELIIRARKGENVLVDACIGSGKTTTIQVLYSEFRSEKRILYLTYNKLLKFDAQEKIGRLNVTSYHGFALKAIKDIGLSLESVGQSDYIQKFLEVKNKLKINNQYDMLVLDEYQDIDQEIADMLEFIKECNRNIQIIAVGDMEQKIYDKTTLNIKEFIGEFLGQHTKIKFTQCFRLSKEHASMLGGIWNKTIKGVNENCRIQTMTIEKVIQFLGKQEVSVSNLLCLGARTGTMTYVLNEIERLYPTKFNKNTVYASIRDEDSKSNNLSDNVGIFTTYDSCKGMERKTCIVFDFTEEYWQIRSSQDLQKYEILRNVFCVAASRGKENIIFVNDEGNATLLTEETLKTSTDEVSSFKKPFEVSNMFDYKRIEDIKECYSLLNITKIKDNEDTSIIEVNTSDGLIDLSPCVGVYQEAMYFEKYNINKAIAYAERGIFTDKKIQNWEDKDINYKILVLTYYNTNQIRYTQQVNIPFITDKQRKAIVNRLNTMFTSYETVQKSGYLRLLDKNNNVLSLCGRLDVIKDDIIYELKFVNELSKEHFLQLACYLILFKEPEGILWNIKDNSKYFVEIPDRSKFLKAVIKTVTKGKITDFEAV